MCVCVDVSSHIKLVARGMYFLNLRNVLLKGGVPAQSSTQFRKIKLSYSAFAVIRNLLAPLFAVPI